MWDAGCGMRDARPALARHGSAALTRALLVVSHDGNGIDDARQAEPVSRRAAQRWIYRSFFGPRLIQGPTEPELEPGTGDDDFAPVVVQLELVETPAGATVDAVEVATGQRPGRIGVLPQ